jgi:hypothetical protein
LLIADFVRIIADPCCSQTEQLLELARGLPSWFRLENSRAGADLGRDRHDSEQPGTTLADKPKIARSQMMLVNATSVWYP